MEKGGQLSLKGEHLCNVTVCVYGLDITCVDTALMINKKPHTRCHRPSTPLAGHVSVLVFSNSNWTFLET